MLNEGISKLQGTSLSEKDHNDDKFERYISAEMIMTKISTRKNVASMLLGQRWGEAVLDVLIYKGLRSRLRSVLLLLLWWVGQILGALSLFGVLSPDYGILGGLLGLPCLIINCYFPLILDVLKMLFTRFDTWYMIYNILAVCICLPLLFRDGRGIFILTGLLISGLWSTLTDAMPTGMRRVTTICGLGFAICLIFAIQAGLYFNAIAIEDARYIIYT